MKRRFKKLAFRTFGVMLGLWLGWQAAVLAEGDYAEVPIAPSDAQGSWYPMVIAIAIGLFVAAVVIGRPALKLKGEDPPDPADDHHGHDDHGDHGDGHGDHGDDKDDH